MSRFLTIHIAWWVTTYVTEAAATRLGRVMDWEEFIIHRRFGVDEISFLLLSEYVQGIDLPDEVRRLPAMQDARARGSEWIGLYNDIYSAEKEAAVGYQHNGVLVVAAQDSCTIQEAVNRVNDRMTLMQRFEATIRQAPDQLATISNDPAHRHDLERVLEGYRHVVRGNFDYHIMRPRYVDATNYLPNDLGDGQRPEFSSAEIFQAIPREGRR